MYLVVDELALGRHEGIALLGVVVEKSGIDFGLFVLEGNVT